jgi:cyclopropane fatty-acyl-phospholipid synthase-like methyltransferase
MDNDVELKQYSWFVSKCYLIIMKFFKNSYVVDNFKSRIDTSKKVLEIGSGAGNDFSLLKVGYDIVGSDYSDTFLKELRKKFKSDKFLKLNALTMELEEKYDVIFSNKVLQHLSKKQLIESFKKQYESLNDGGLLFHAMWRGNSDEGENKSIPFVRYQQSDIDKMKGKFKIKEFVVYKEMKEDDSFIVILEK